MPTARLTRLRFAATQRNSLSTLTLSLTEHNTPNRPSTHSLDTGRLNPETYQLFDAVEKHYGIRIEYTFPDAQETMELVRAKGMYSFYEDGHQECCRVRKVRWQRGREAGFGGLLYNRTRQLRDLDTTA